MKLTDRWMKEKLDLGEGSSEVVEQEKKMEWREYNSRREEKRRERREDDL